MSTPESGLDRFWQKVEDGHQREVAKGLHDEQCEWTKGFYICHCSKRRREAEGFTEPPKEDLYFPPPSCPRCDRDLEFDGDGFSCHHCRLQWDPNGSAKSAMFTDDYGDISWCEEHQRRACTLRHG